MKGGFSVTGRESNAICFVNICLKETLQISLKFRISVDGIKDI